MLKFHSIIRPTASESFFDQSVDLWLGFASGHMGPQMYQHHEGARQGQSMSGVLTWDMHAKHGTIPAHNKEVFLSHIADVARHIEKKTPIVEFGPGSMDDASLLIHSIESSEYIPVDCNLDVIRQARTLSEAEKDCTIAPSVIDFFSDENCSLTEHPALGVFLGITIGNIPGSAPQCEPRDALIKAFRNLTKATPAGGYLLVSTDVCQDGDRNKALYNEHWHRLFGVNHLYRMAEELPMNNFDPDGFEYLPVWHENSSLLAHTVIATKNQNFEMGNQGEVLVSVKREMCSTTTTLSSIAQNSLKTALKMQGLKLFKAGKVSAQSASTYFMFRPAMRETVSAHQHPIPICENLNLAASVLPLS